MNAVDRTESPTALPVEADSIPTALRERNAWVVWTPDKAPRQPEAPNLGGDIANRPDHRTDFNTAMATYRQRSELAGVGYVFDADGPMVGIDLDDCREPKTGELEPWAVSIITELDTFTEVSPSGSGVHIYAIGEKPGDRCRAGMVEMYDRRRFFTVTGNRLSLTPPTVERRDSALRNVYDKHLARDEVHSPSPTGNAEAVSLSDSDLLERAKNAANGAKFSRLWQGDIGQYDSHSEADLALCNLLAFWTGGDHQRIDELFRQSGLYREKWERETYRRLTIDRAVNDCSSFYNPNVGTSVIPSEPTAPAVADGGRNKVSWTTIQLVGEALADVGSATTAELSSHSIVDRGQRQVRRALKELERNSWVESTPDGRSRVYHMSASLTSDT